MKGSKEPDFVCPHCGADVPGGSKSCPECGSDDQTGWSEDTYLDGVSLPDPDEEFDDEASKPKGILGPARLLWIAFAVILVALWLLQMLKR